MRPQGLAFAYGPDGYWVEIAKRQLPGASSWSE
jgi:hypothetical protein